ncbi:MAG: ATP-binding cassette domain-containing protein [Actinobacteria bacterium]|nr:ATP-binding cassette domain-containing protein [Actinomycetota bacterium]
MTELILFILLGLGTGAVYALSALGVVVIARGSNVLSFAQGGFGLVGAYCWYEATRAGVSPAAATIIGVAAAGLVGVLCYLLVMRPLRGASALTKAVATLGVLAVLRAVADLVYGDSLKLVSGPLPHAVVEPLHGVSLSADRLWLVAVAVAITAGVWALLRFTRFGLATRAVAESERTASAVGLAPDRVAALNWGLGAALGGLAGVLVAPITGLSVAGVALLSLSGLAAALFGQFRSLPLTLLGALLLGVAESVLGLYVETPGIAKAAPFAAVIVILALRPGSMVSRARVRTRLPRVGAGEIRWPWLAAALAAAVVLTLVLDAQWADALTTTFVVSAIALSLVVLTGYTNQLSLAQHAIAGVGALVAARASQDLGLPFLLCLTAGMLAVVPLALAMALPALRTRGVALAVVTLGFAVVIEQVILSNDSLTGGLAGTAVAAPAIGPLRFDPVADPKAYALLCLAYLALASVAVAGLRRSHLGRQMIAVRDNPAAAEAIGVNAARVRGAAFSIAAMIAAGGGVLAAFRTPSVSFEQFGLTASITDVIVAVVGGVGFVAGPLVGSLVVGVGAGGKLLIDLFPNLEEAIPLLGGLALLAVLIAAPDGVAGAAAAWLGRRLPGRTRVPVLRVGEGEDGGGQGAAGAELAVRGLGASFGGVRALDGVSFDVRPGEIVGVVGANGAGKTTAIDVIGGRVGRHDGTVTLGGRALHGWPSWRRARAGVGRSFQALELFEGLSVLENLLVGAGGSGAELAGPAALAVEELHLEDDLPRRPDELPYGRRRLVALARVLAAGPAVLLLDEPSAGLDRRASAELGELLRRLASEWRLGIVLVEHDVRLVMSVCDRVVALEAGRVVAAGEPREVRTDQRVVASFLGPAAGLEAAR